MVLSLAQIACRCSRVGVKRRDDSEGCESGRIGALGKRVKRKLPWVRIPPPPPFAFENCLTHPQIALPDGRVPERPNGTVSKTVVGVCLPWVQIPPLPPTYLTRTSEAQLNRSSRHALIERYLGAVHGLGAVSLHGRALRDLLRSGSCDLWSASSVRESSLWTDPLVFERLSALQDGRAVLHGDNSPKVVSQPRVVGAWGRALLHALLNTARSHRLQTTGDVILVEYLPASYQATGEGQSQYFGALPSLLCEMNHKVGYLHVHSDGPATRPTRAARNTLRQLNGAVATHELVADYLTIGVWLRAVRIWWKLRRNAPTSAAIQAVILPNSNLAHLWPSWQPMYEHSVRGTHSVRTCLLSAMFDAAVKHRSPSTVWISAFEGQSWEACLARSLEHHKMKWLPYLHTMMRPWDLRARSFLGEITPEVLAVHGQHDKEELAPLGVPLTDVEALRYQHLGSSSKPEIGTHAATPLNNRAWLVVGGAECTQSNNELAEFLAAMSRQSVQRSVVVRWHPQCGTPAMQLPDNVVLTTEPLATVAKQVTGALLVGTAAPLDTYLSGVPSCAFVATSGFAMSPIEENAYFHAATTADDAVRWLQTAEMSAGFVPPVADYFIIDSSLQRWGKLLRSLITA